MKDIANWALNVATMRGATYADARIVADRSRALATKNGKVGSASDAESVGMSVRVIADGAWGFAASEIIPGPRWKLLRRRQSLLLERRHT